ncbi:MAG: hypothetical protein HUU22_17070 [Phycisphaerae bacterium]|nr:hypothetical protein [Phycisphaerae bacterium]NUQ47733.1 hypothetical protein [Phycisphaerae bacterium]
MLDESIYLVAADGSNDAHLFPASLWGGVVMMLLAARNAASTWPSPREH